MAESLFTYKTQAQLGYDWSKREWYGQQRDKYHAQIKSDPKLRAEIYRSQGKLDYQSDPKLRAEIYRKQGKGIPKPDPRKAIVKSQKVDPKQWFAVPFGDNRNYGRGNRGGWGGSMGGH